MIRTLLIAFFTLSFLLNANAQKKVPSDVAKNLPKPYDYKKNEQYKGIEIQTHYLTMRDGVKIAVDVYLPKNRKAGDQFPTVLHQTRYWRSPQLRFPFSLISNGLLGSVGTVVKEMCANGYAIVNVDARGSGASFGSRKHPWTDDETKDGAEIIDWIISQDWSDQEVGSMGVSYSGTTAEFLTFNQHPNLKAVIVMYSLFDVYDDIAYPGGIFQYHFVNDWGKFNASLDRNKLPRGGLLAKMMVKGVKKIKTSNKNKVFKAALQDHEQNLNVDQTAKGVEFRDQAPPGNFIDRADVFSPFTYVDKTNESDVAVYCYTGWWDGDYVHSNIKRYLTLTNPKNKLLIGPWEHGGNLNCSPANPSKSGFDHVSEFIKYFDYHLKGMNNGLYEEPRIHYFTMMEEEWKSADNWPPKATEKKLFLSDNKSLSFQNESSKTDFDAYKMDTTARTGRKSRWRSVIGDLHTPEVYPERTEQSKKMLCYYSEPLKKDTEITGHPIAQLFVSADQPDANFHVYLEEVDPNGKVTYVTEGLLRAIHRKTVDEFPFYNDVVPQRTYYEKDIAPLIEGEVVELTFDLLPTSYQFKKGNRIQIGIAGADQDHFKVMHKAEANIKVYHNEQYPSNVLLPIK